MKILFLGTGNSLGVPVIGCNCSVCMSQDNRNKRMRPSILIQNNGKNILIDTSSDFYHQAIKHDVREINAILYTHAHADHILGLDDIRILAERAQSQIPVYGSEETLSSINHMFGYAFKEKLWKSETHRLRTVVVSEEFTCEEIQFVPVPVFHDKLPVFGYRFENVAYVTDVSSIPPDSMSKLKDLDLLIISTLRYAPHRKHLSVDQVVELMGELKPKKVLFTHISHGLEHNEFDKYTPENMSPAFDGMVVNI